MKTFKNLFHQIASFENLLLAAQNAAKGKREKSYVIEFFFKLEENLYQIQNELSESTYQPGRYRTFRIYDPKPRMISAAPFRDRVVHHALMNIIGPLLERSFIFDSYANRVGKGTHKAIRRYQKFLRKYSFALKCDIKQYFPSIDHTILKSLARKRLGCKKTLSLIDTIIDASNFQEGENSYFPQDDLFTPFDRRKGLPIGNLTSQFFANYYLDPLDHFVQQQLGCCAYVRYVDDFVLFSNSKKILHHWKKRIADFLQQYRLNLHPTRCNVYSAQNGNQFLGQLIFRTHRRLSSENVHKFKKRFNEWQKYPCDNAEQRIASWMGHANQANSFCLLGSLGLQRDESPSLN